MAKTLESKGEKYLKRCIELATESLEAGDSLFGTIYSRQRWKIIAEGRNRVKSIQKIFSQK